MRSRDSESLLPSEVRTARLVLRRQHPHDAPLVKEAVDSSLAHLQAAVAWAQSAPFPLATLVSRLAAAAAAFDAGHAWAFSIFDLEQTRVVGGAGLERAEAALTALVGPSAVETGYWLRSDATGYGYATEAVSVLTLLALTHLGAQRVVICHDPVNAASEGVPRRLGFRCLDTVSSTVLPGRLAANGSLRAATKVWVLDAPETDGASSGGLTPLFQRTL
jgi:RimJ/RimL family protein N-acetyltransferase